MAGVPVLDPDALRSELARQEPAPVYLLAGPDGWRAERTAAWLREKVVDATTADFNAQVLYADEVGPGAVAEAAAAYPMFGGRRFVWLRHAEALPAGHAVEPLLRYLESPSPSTVLVMTSSKLDKRLKLTAACAAAGRVVDFQPLGGGALLAQVGRQAARHGVTLSRQAVGVLVDLVGEDLGELDTELAKLALLKAEGEEIGPEEVRSLVAQSRDLNAFQLADQMDPRRPRQALRTWLQLRSTGGDVIGTAAIVGWRLRQLAQLRAALDEGHRPADAGRLVGLPPWQLKNLLPLVEAMDREAVARTLERLREADRRAKSSGLGAEVAYDLALLAWAVEGAS